MSITTPTLLAIAASFVCSAAQSADTLRLGLSDCMDRAMSDNLEIVEQELIKDDYAAQRSHADASRYLTRLFFRSQFGVVPDAEGNIITDRINTSISELSPFFRMDIEAGQPLYTWGRLTSLRNAAQSGVESQGFGIQATRNQVAGEVVELYYGVLLAREVLRVAEDAAEKLDAANRRVRELIDEGSTTVRRRDRYKLDVYAFQVEEQRAKAEKGRELASAALRRVLAIDPGKSYEVANNRLRPVRAAVEPLQNYIELARRNRPELSQVRLGVEARRWQWEASKAERWPILALGGRFNWHEAPGRDLSPSNPGLGDSWNSFSGGAAFVIQGELNLGISNAKARRAHIAYRQMQRRQRWAHQSIDLDVTKALRDVVEADSNFRAARRARRAAKAWLRDSHEQYDIGLLDTKEVLEAYTAFATTEGSYFEAVYNQRVAFAKLDEAVGNPVWTLTDELGHIGITSER